MKVLSSKLIVVEAAAVRRNTGVYLSQFATFPLTRFNQIYLIYIYKKPKSVKGKLEIVEDWTKSEAGEEEGDNTVGGVEKGRKYKYR